MDVFVEAHTRNLAAVACGHVHHPERVRNVPGGIEQFGPEVARATAPAHIGERWPDTSSVEPDGMALQATAFGGDELPASRPVAGPASRDLQATYRTALQGDTAEKRRELFRIGYRLLQEKDRAGARLLLSRALEVYPPLADYSLYFLGVLNREDGHTVEARAFFLRLLEQYAQSIWTSQAAVELASLALAEKVLAARHP